MLTRLLTLAGLAMFSGLSIAETMPEPARDSHADPLRASAVYRVQFVPFSTPAIVQADGTLVFPAEPVAAPDPVIAEVTEPAVEPVHPVRWVAATRVNVRAGPSTANPVLGQVAFSDAVLVVEETGSGWSRIRVEGDGIEGFMASRFLQDQRPE